MPGPYQGFLTSTRWRSTQFNLGSQATGSSLAAPLPPAHTMRLGLPAAARRLNSEASTVSTTKSIKGRQEPVFSNCDNQCYWALNLRLIFMTALRSLCSSECCRSCRMSVPCCEQEAGTQGHSKQAGQQTQGFRYSRHHSRGGRELNATHKQSNGGCWPDQHIIIVYWLFCCCCSDGSGRWLLLLHGKLCELGSSRVQLGT